MLGETGLLDRRFISPLFFAAIGGAPLALAYKMANTLDSMTGYKDDRYIKFGKASARMDDLLNFLPAGLAVPVIAPAAASVLKYKSGARALKTAFPEGKNHDSPNAGYPEAAFAGALGVRMGGPAIYGGKLVDKPRIGGQFKAAKPFHIGRACDIMLLSSFFRTLISWAADFFLRF